MSLKSSNSLDGHSPNFLCNSFRKTFVRKWRQLNLRFHHFCVHVLRPPSVRTFTAVTDQLQQHFPETSAFKLCLNCRSSSLAISSLSEQISSFNKASSLSREFSCSYVDCSSGFDFLRGGEGDDIRHSAKRRGWVR